MGLLILIGFAGALIVLGFLSCIAGGSSEGSHMRGDDDELSRPKWRARR